MHSSRMRTARLLAYPGGGGVCIPGGGCWYAYGGMDPGGVCPTPPTICLGGLLRGRGRSAYRGGGRPPLWTEWLTDRCKNITFPQLRLRAVITIGRFYVVSLGNGIKYPTIRRGSGWAQGEGVASRNNKYFLTRQMQGGACSSSTPNFKLDTTSRLKLLSEVYFTGPRQYF